jgi:O-antigen/teichoic acid export membrane protein
MDQIKPGNSIFKNTFFSGITAFSNLCYFLLTLLAARKLGEVDYGKFCFALAFVTLFEVLISSGFSRLMIREVARDKSTVRNYVNNILPMMMISAALSVVVIFFVAGIQQTSPDGRLAVQILAVSMVFKTFSVFFRSLFRAYEIFQWETLATLIERVSLLVGGIGVLYAGLGLVALCSVFPIIRGLNLLITVFLISKMVVAPRLAWDWQAWKRIVRNSIPFALATMTFTIYYRIDTVMLSFLKNDKEVGWYNAAYQLVEGLILIATVISPVVFVRFSVLYVHSKESLRSLFEKVSRYMLAIAVPISVLGVILAPKGVLFLYGPQYLASGLALQTMIVGTVFIFLRILCGTMLGAVDRQMVYLKIVGASLLLNVGANFFLIPRYGAFGASIATLLTESIMGLVLFSAAAGKEGMARQILKLGLKPFFASMTAGGVVVFLRDFHVVLLSMTGAITYLGILSVTKFWTVDEISAFKKKVHLIFAGQKSM